MKDTLIKELQEQLNQLFESNKEIMAVYLFGSQAGEYAVADSDLDLAIFVENKDNFPKRKFAKKVIKEIEIPYELDISFIDYKSPPIFLFQIIKNGESIYSKNKDQRAVIEGKIMHIYYDTQHMRNIYSYYLDKSLKKGETWK
jgi:predicted nucleotidyltransferase